MRLLTSLLFALLLAAALAIGAYAASWSLRREPRAEVAPPAAPTPAPLTPPTRLADSPDYARTMPAAPGRGDAATAELTIEVVGLPSAWQPPDAGLAVAGSSGGIAWRPLPPAAEGSGDRVCRQACAVGDTVVVALAPARTNALRTYFVRATATVAGDATIRLDARGAEVTIRHAEAGQRGGPYQLRRDGDDEWLPAQAPAGVHLDAPVRLWLGQGGYRLAEVADPARGIAFTVPETAEVAVSGRQLPAPDDRR